LHGRGLAIIVALDYDGTQASVSPDVDFSLSDIHFEVDPTKYSLLLEEP
jgi:hypothetical protein